MMKSCKRKENYMFMKLLNNSFEVLLDDTDESPASKFKNFDLIGIPYQSLLAQNKW